MNFLANIALPKSNPAAPGKKPKEVEYRVKRDVMTTYPAYFAQIAVFGAIHTILPGSAIRKAEQ